MSQQPPAKNSPIRFMLIATLIALAIIIGIALWKNGYFRWGSNVPQYETPPLSEDYLPSDTTAVLRVNWRETQDSKYVKQNFGPVLRQYREEFAPAGMLQALGIDADKDLEWFQLIVAAGDHEHPLLVLSGKFDPVNFKTMPNGLQQIKEPPGDRYRLFSLPYPRTNGKLTLTASDRLLLVSDKASRVTDALADGAAGRMPALQDRLLEEILRKKVDRKQSLWGAATLNKPKPPPFPPLEPFGSELNKIVTASDAVYGGLTFADDVQGAMYFQTNSAAKASEVEHSLSHLLPAVKAAVSPWGKLATPPQFVPLLELVAACEVTRDDDIVVLRRRLPQPK
jgi:hypothetical protein